jgi:hypothetical protein
MVGGDKMTVLIVSALVALVITMALVKLDNYYNSKEIVFEMEDDKWTDR